MLSRLTIRLIGSEIAGKILKTNPCWQALRPLESDPGSLPKGI
jgi:hypothetical protein